MSISCISLTVSDWEGDNICSSQAAAEAWFNVAKKENEQINVIHLNLK